MVSSTQTLAQIKSHWQHVLSHVSNGIQAFVKYLSKCGFTLTFELIKMLFDRLQPLRGSFNRDLDGKGDLKR